MVDAYAALQAVLNRTYYTTPANQSLKASTGLGFLEKSRGSYHVYADLNGDGKLDQVKGEVDVFGIKWDARSWAARSWSSTGWTSSVWSTYFAETAGWLTTSWSGRSWSGTTWDGRSWSSSAFVARSWSDAGWS